MTIRISALLLAICILLSGCELNFDKTEYGFAREVSESEKAARLALVTAAESWLGCKESDGSHKPIIDLYNSHQPLAQGYLVQYSDQWCATFVSAAAIKCGFTDIIPTECGCQRQIALFDAIGCWEEDDTYIPLPGDIIFYASDDKGQGDCTDWSDHVGIVVGTNGNKIKVIEGNNTWSVRYRYICVNDATIRGYGIPDYSGK